MVLSAKTHFMLTLTIAESFKLLITETIGTQGTIEKGSTLIIVEKAFIFFHDLTQIASESTTLVILKSFMVFQIF